MTTLTEDYFGLYRDNFKPSFIIGEIKNYK